MYHIRYIFTGFNRENILNHYQQLAFISAFKDNLTIENNLKRHDYMSELLTRLNISHNPVEGMFKNKAEKSFMVHLTHITTLELVQSVAIEFEQEAVLYRDSNGQVWLVNSKGDQESVGTFRKISEEQAGQVTAWTKINSEFFTTTKDNKSE